jgi:hypothetical protein
MAVTRRVGTRKCTAHRFRHDRSDDWVQYKYLRPCRAETLRPESKKLPVLS